MRLKAFRWTALGTIATSSIVVACNLGDGAYFSGGGFAGSSGAVFDAGSSAFARSTCDEITEGVACATSEIDTCETKVHANLACNRALRCTSSRRWSSTAPERDACASDCPSAFVADPPDACAIPNAGTLICEYPEGTCGCAPVRPVEHDAGDAGDAGAGTGTGGPGAEDAGEFDGGDVDAGPTTYEWRCVTPEAGCPRTRPPVGTACVRPMACDYGDCLFDDGVTMHCYSRHWVSEKRCSRRTESDGD